ncbi:MAG TPA: hypothetical protein VGL05_19720 [Kribbella sp.]
MSDSAPFDITVQGCDDATDITVDLTPSQLTFLTEIAEKITAASEVSCMPKMSIRPHVAADGER